MENLFNTSKNVNITTNIKTYNKSEVSHQLEKNGDIWNFVDKSVNFFLK